jgi:hypothetical protein
LPTVPPNQFFEPATNGPTGQPFHTVKERTLDAAVSPFRAKENHLSKLFARFPHSVSYAVGKPIAFVASHHCSLFLAEEQLQTSLRLSK